MEIILSLTAIAGVIIAALGLRTWKKQLYGKSGFEVARKLLKATYNYREAIQKVRHPFMGWTEMNPKESSETREHFRSVANAYEKRWNKVTESKIEIKTELLEAEVLWGDTIKNEYKNLFETGNKLFTNLRRYLENLNPDSNINLDYNDDIIYSQPVGIDEYSEDDEYTNKLTECISKIEDALKEHLNRK